MKTRSHRSLLLLCGCLFGIFAAITGRAEDFYVAETTLGNGSGASASNAKSVEWFNTSGSWASTKTAGKIGPGDTVRLVGTISSRLFVQTGGSSGKPITILFQKDAKLSSPAWSAGGAIVINDKDHIVVDGGENGLIENTANGSPERFPNQVSSIGVLATNSSYLVIKDLAIRNLYVRTSTSDTNGGGHAIRCAASSSSTFSWVQIQNCEINDAERGISIVYRAIPVTNIEIKGNRIYNIDDGIFIGDGSGGSFANTIKIYQNHISNFSKWDEPGSNKFHHDGMHIFALGYGSEIKDVEVYGNTIGSDYGRFSTSGVYFSGTVTESMIYNNVFLGDIDTPANGLVTLRLKDKSNVSVYNNTFVGNGTYGRAIYLNGADGGNKSTTIVNNLATKITFIATTYSSSWNIVSDYNLGHELIPTREYSHSTTSSGSFKTPPQWQTLGFDLNGRYTNALLNTNHELSIGSPAIDSGKDLSAYFSTDKNGVVRPVGAGWDIGAYESLSGLTGTSPIIDDSIQVVVDETPTNTGDGSTTGDVVIDFEEPATEPSTEPATEEPVLVVDSSTGSTGSTTDTSSSTEDTIEVVFNPAPSTETTPTTDTTTSEPIIVADSSPTTDGSGSTSEPTSAGNTLEPPTTSEPVIVADSSTSTDTATAPDSSTPTTTEPAPSTDSSTVVVVDSSTSEPAPSTDSPTVVVVDSSTGTDSTDTSTEPTSPGKPGNGFGRENNGKILKTARIL